MSPVRMIRSPRGPHLSNVAAPAGSPTEGVEGPRRRETIAVVCVPDFEWRGQWGPPRVPGLAHLGRDCRDSLVCRRRGRGETRPERGRAAWKLRR